MRWIGMMECLLIDLIYIRKHSFFPIFLLSLSYLLPFVFFGDEERPEPDGLGEQARLQASTAACARRGPTRLDPVRLCHAMDWHDGMSAHRSLMYSETLVRPHILVLSLPFALSLSLAMMRDLSKMAWRAGATTGLNCSLCQAGTYQTGSGETLPCDGLE